ncbi:MAG TPA: alpha/beta hydrolase [Bryobacteraceae bacterium]|jgi:pimeloyl-ACP methyl ester carboxylesterase|nr:alpha/beta hydrolase [Bryobacteraceae bacterium]
MTVFLLPGLLCDETVWADQSPALRGIADVIVPDFRYVNSISAMAQLVLDAAPERFSVVGHSMGGRVALEVFRMAPDRVERLALLDTGIHPRGAHEESKRGELVDLARTQGMAAMAARWLPPMFHPDHSALLPFLTEMVQRSTPETFANQQRALLDRPDARIVLPLIQCPTLVLCGRQDAWSPVSQHEEIAAAIMHSKLVIVEDSGHMSTVEQPAAVTKALLSHLQDQTLQV